jgi:hypothetical protein
MQFLPIDPSILDENYLSSNGSGNSDDKSFKIISNWVRNYLCKPHSKLGRPGPVCPFTAPAVKLGQIWIAVAPNTANTVDTLAQVSLEGKEFFLNAPENKNESKDYKAVMILFPHLNTHDGHMVIESTQRLLKPSFVSMGLMFGQFYQGCPEPGLANPMFRPLFSPIPLLATRYMVASDIAFLQEPNMFKHYRRYFPESGEASEKRIAS